MKNDIFKFITVFLLAISGFLAFKVTNLSSDLNSIKEACGSKCTDTLVKFNIPGVLEAINKIDVSKSEVKACLDTAQTAEVINTHLENAQVLGITGTPGNILLNRENGLTVFIPGAYPLVALNGARDALLKEDIAVGDNAYSDTANNIFLEVTQMEALLPVSENENIMGDKESIIALIEYSDFDCPYCATFHPIAEEFVTQHEDTMWVFRHMPLRKIHPDAQKKAEATECVKNIAGLDAFWKFAQELYNTSHTE